MVETWQASRQHPRALKLINHPSDSLGDRTNTSTGRTWTLTDDSAAACSCSSAHRSRWHGKGRLRMVYSIEYSNSLLVDSRTRRHIAPSATSAGVLDQLLSDQLSDYRVDVPYIQAHVHGPIPAQCSTLTTHRSCFGMKRSTGPVSVVVSFPCVLHCPDQVSRPGGRLNETHRTSQDVGATTC